MNAGRKIPSASENPIDDVVISLAESVIPALRRAGITPNALTTVGLLCGLAAARCLAAGRPKVASLLYVTSYFFDCADGNMARRYGMVTEFGDYYDHAADLAKHAALAWTLLSLPSSRLTGSAKMRILVLAGLLLCASFVHIGCQEISYGRSEEGKSLSATTGLCPHPTEAIRFTRFFGIGTFVAFVALAIALVPATARRPFPARKP